MKRSLIVGSLVGTALLLSGCYTVLMTPSSLEPAADSNGYYSGTASAAELNYGSNCLSCHSSAELDDRYDEMQSLGIHTVHGVVVDPYGWRNPETSIPWWYNMYAPPLPASAASQPSNGNSKAPRRRVGETRDGGTTASPTPQAPSGGSSSAPATGNASSASQQPQQTAQPAQSQERQRSGSDSSGTTRKTGSTRGSGK